jgi:hypothetical protein
MNDESIKEAQQLCKDLELLCSEDITLLEYIIDEYVYLLDDDRKAQLRKLVDQELEHDYA